MNSKLIKIFSVIIITIIAFSFIGVNAYSDYEVKEADYSDEYKQWLELSDEEKEKVVKPRKYNIIQDYDNSTYIKSIDNVFKAQQLLRAAIPTKYDLRSLIPENLKVRDQMQTNTCWAFSTLGALESTLALSNYNAGLPVTEYDFSERHMSYGLTRDAFLNGEINEYGYSRNLSDGGNFWMAMQYLTNGMGAVNEEDLPFENNESDIDISEIENPNVQTTIYDSKEIPALSQDEIAQRDQVVQTIKEHVMNYGGVYANVHGPNLNGENTYNNKTGAVYCDNQAESEINHSVLIVGWDDDYSVDNFNEEKKPTSNGAWIVKNSWGEYTTESLSNIKQQIFDQDKEEGGWSSPDEIDNSIVQQVLDDSFGEGKATIVGDEVHIEVGIDGFMYYSYEDVTIYSGLGGIEKATATKDYDNIYQNDVLGPNGAAVVSVAGVGNLANVFTRDKNKEEVLDKISIYSYKGYEYKVLVNPNNDSKDPQDLIEVELKEGDTQEETAGYHVLEFANPIRLTGDKFVVVVQILNSGNEKYVSIEKQEDGTNWETAEVNEGESFFASESEFASNSWQDMATWQNETVQGNLCIKAYTKNQEKADLTEIYIDKAPDKTEYTEGENFDATGMVVIAKYGDLEEEITNYEIIGGDNLQEGTTSVTIRYTEDGITKETTQTIKVNGSGQGEEKTLESIYISQKPTKLIYNEGENFDDTGMVVIAKYSDGTEKEISNYEIIDGDNLQIETTSVIIRYQENEIIKETMQTITVKNEQEEVVTLEEIYIKTEPNKTNYKPGENFDNSGMVVIAKYSDGSEKEITNYEIVGGDNLQEGTTSVTIRYTENGIIRNKTQKILVSEEEPVNPDNPSKEPIPADFSSAEAKITESKLYFNSNNLNEATGEITIKVTGIIVEDDTYTEHSIKYYISGSQDELYEENNNERTATLEKESDGTYSMTINLSSDDIDNYDEIVESNALFLHISETASLKENTDEFVTVFARLEVENTSEPQCYIDGNYVGGIDDVLNYNNSNNNNNNNNNNNGDDTTAGGFLPYAGRTILIVISILVVAVSGIIAYNRYKYIDR